MNTLKEAVVVKEHIPDAEMKMFAIDVRAFSKGFEEFYQRTINEGMITVNRGKPSRILPDPETNDAIVFYENSETGETKKEHFDIVVLASALIAPKSNKPLAEALGVELDEHGFFKPREESSSPLCSSREGIFLAGCTTTPKDITDSIIEASGAASLAGTYIKETISAEVKEESIEEEPVEPVKEPTTPEELRIGVFLCHCGINIAGFVDMQELHEYSETLPGVVLVQQNVYSCSSSAQENIAKAIKDHNLNRIVIASCSPRTHLPIFMDTAEKTGLNPYLVEMTNIRDQCSWVHMHDREGATNKAKDLVRMSVARASNLERLSSISLTLEKTALVIGGGIAGLKAAADLARRGFKTTLIEKANKLGGHTSELSAVYPSFKPGAELVKEFVEEVEKQGVEVYTNAKLEEVSGFVGNFDINFSVNGKTYNKKIGAIVIASGFALANPPDKYKYKKLKNVVKNIDLERALLKGEKLPKRIAFIQCVGSRGENNNPACSRYCCQASIKQAIAVREKGSEVVVFYRDMRVYQRSGEELYWQARKMGVRFLRLTEQREIEILGARKVEAVKAKLFTGQTVEYKCDAVVLAVGMVPRQAETDELVEKFKVQRSEDGFFMERHPKLGPVETAIEGVFLAGTCQSPKDIGDSVAQASAAASKIATLLNHPTVYLPPVITRVNEQYCRGCGKCVDVCEFLAIQLVEREEGYLVAEVNPALCKGCGSCVKECASQAIILKKSSSKRFAFIIEEKCVGCGQCVHVCPNRAISIPWGQGLTNEEFQEKLIEYTYGVLKGKEKKSSFLNFVIKVTKECDCLSRTQKPIMEDIGILASLDPIAIEKATVDLIFKNLGYDLFGKIHSKAKWWLQQEYGEKIGLGSRDYKLIKIS